MRNCDNTIRPFRGHHRISAGDQSNAEAKFMSLARNACDLLDDRHQELHLIMIRRRIVVHRLAFAICLRLAFPQPSRNHPVWLSVPLFDRYENICSQAQIAGSLKSCSNRRALNQSIDHKILAKQPKYQSIAFTQTISSASRTSCEFNY